MNMLELAGYGAPATVVERWRAYQGETLLPLQEKAVRTHQLFGDENLLVQAPTSSGKTFIGEMAAVHAANARGKVAYLLPLKALAEEKYCEFNTRYGGDGARVIVCTRDHRRFDSAFERGDFDIAVAVYEKLEALATSHPERLRELALVVADELEVLSDPERGAAIEALLTRLLTAGVRIVGLSAVLGDPAQSAAWLNARLLEHDRRPVELRYGVLFEGTYRYCGHNDPAEGEELFETCHSGAPWEDVALNARRLAEAGESCLVFVKARREAWRGAEMLARRLNLPAANAALETLHCLEPTRSRDLLLRCLETGAAFHSADLLPAERRAVENGFRTGEIKVMVATSTLATGMNLPARNVFISADKWIYDARLELPWRAPISQGEFENMSGRAGRYGAGGVSGRAILVAASTFDRDSLWRRYVKGVREPVQPQLARAPLEDTLLALIASRCCRTTTELMAFLGRTLSARAVWRDERGVEECGFRLRAALRRCIEVNAVRAIAENGATVLATDAVDLDALRFEAAPMGRVVAGKGVSLNAARAMCHWLRLSEQRDWCILDLLTALALLPDAGLRQISLTRAEYENADYPARLKRETAAYDLRADVPINRLRNCRLTPFYDEVRAIKTALFLSAWVDGDTLETVENAFDVTAGQIRAAADQLAWLADTTAALAEALDMQPDFIARLNTFAEQLRHGVAEALLPLATSGVTLTRPAMLNLEHAGMAAPAALAQTDTVLLEQWMDADTARALKMWAMNQTRDVEERKTTSAQYTLVIDERRPNAVQWNGAAIPLQEKQYRLLLALARRPDVCVPYDIIYQEVWGETVVEENQMHYQKRALVKRLNEAGINGATFIATTPRRGFRLKLPAEQVLLVKAVTHAA